MPVTIIASVVFVSLIFMSSRIREKITKWHVRSIFGAVSFASPFLFEVLFKLAQGYSAGIHSLFFFIMAMIVGILIGGFFPKMLLPKGVKR